MMALELLDTKWVGEIQPRPGSAQAGEVETEHGDVDHVGGPVLELPTFREGGPVWGRWSVEPDRCSSERCSFPGVAWSSWSGS
jgi:hypothetical protein